VHSFFAVARSTSFCSAMPHVLWVGDSISYYNGGVWAELDRLGAGHTHTQVMKGGMPLHKLCEAAVKALKAPWPEGERRGCLVLQEDLPETSVEEFEAAVEAIAQANHAGAEAHGKRELLLLSCWPYRGLPPRPELLQLSHTQLAAHQRRVAALHGARVVPCGQALLIAQAELPHLPMLNAKDEEHPSPAMTYLMALCVYGVLHGEQELGYAMTYAWVPPGLPPPPLEAVAADDVAALQMIAGRAVAAERIHCVG
jgi:hypothetical protein